MDFNIDFITTQDLAKSFVNRAKDDRDVVLAVTGYEGEGKSTYAVAQVIDILKHLGKTDEEILENFNDYMIYSPNKEEMYKKITNKEKYLPINSDEAIKALYKLNWASENQKFLNTLFALCRKENKINILCMPRFSDFNEYFRNHRIMYWLLIVERGTGILMQKDWNPFTKDPWHMEENRKFIDEKMYRKKLIEFDANEKINLLSKTKNFVAIVKWDNIGTRFKNVYLKGKEQFGYTDMDDMKPNPQAGKREERAKLAIENIINSLYQGNTPVKDIAKLTGYSDRRIYEILNLPQVEVRAKPYTLNKNIKGEEKNV